MNIILGSSKPNIELISISMAQLGTVSLRILLITTDMLVNLIMRYEQIYINYFKKHATGLLIPLQLFRNFKVV